MTGNVPLFEVNDEGTIARNEKWLGDAVTMP